MDRVLTCPVMNPRYFLRWVLLLSLACLLPGRLHAADADEKSRIEGLISHVENLKDAKFIRNGSSYGAQDAAKFLRGKWQSKDQEIKTAVDFIDKVATVSSTTGKPYLIRFSDGHEVKCGDYLKAELKK